ncbi:hypothetical protein SDC9_113925 [bioreactor metagenome]|uniref:Uncharacterized protein n=1 Tax=bioreactor metagenome TaxID=1076179 RepID=A0A645BNF3_9ZZZZ
MGGLRGPGLRAGQLLRGQRDAGDMVGSGHLGQIARETAPAAADV